MDNEEFQRTTLIEIETLKKQINFLLEQHRINLVRGKPDALSTAVKSAKTDEKAIITPKSLTIGPLIIDKGAIYNYFKSIQIDNSKCISLLKNELSGMSFLLFYKGGCGSCAEVLMKLKEVIKQEYLESDNLHVVPREHPYAVELANKFKVIEYPSLIVLNKDKILTRYTGQNIVKFMQETFKS